MIIDFHTHVFPDKIAERTINTLSESSGGMKAYSDGTVAGLLDRMNEAGTNISVILPVMTKPSQFESITAFAMNINREYSSGERRLISFAGIHPDMPDIEERMKEIKDKGFLGVKIHPEYQGTFINSDGYLRVFRAAREYDLIVVTHAGFDPGFPDGPIKCTPELILDALSKEPCPKLVLAHLGGNELKEEVISSGILDTGVYLDTAFVLNKSMDEDSFNKIVAASSEDRILFASDSPWSSVKEDVERLRQLVPDARLKERIFEKNARRLLGL